MSFRMPAERSSYFFLRLFWMILDDTENFKNYFNYP